MLQLSFPISRAHRVPGRDVLSCSLYPHELTDIFTPALSLATNHIIAGCPPVIYRSSWR